MPDAPSREAFEAALAASLAGPSARPAFWATLVAALGCRDVAEIGVWKGDFAAALLAACPCIGRYHLVDPWRHLPDWNKPFNVPDAVFAEVHAIAMAAIAPFADRCEVLRGRTADVIGRIPDGSLDFAYVDGDHSLRGIAVDLIATWPKLRPGGVIGGDDLHPTPWQHGPTREPTLVFPFAMYFAEAVGQEIHILPRAQFLIRKPLAGEAAGFAIRRHAPGYDRTDLLGLVAPPG